MDFLLHPQLAADSDLIADLNLSQLRLLNNSHYVWLLLIPRVENAIEIIDLSLDQQAILFQEIQKISQLLKAHFPCDKLNVAALGNVVSQLHVHIIARRHDDIQWPKPVWGGPATAYDSYQKENLITLIQKLLR